VAGLARPVGRVPSGPGRPASPVHAGDPRLARPARIRRLARLPPRPNRTVTLPLAQAIASASGRHQFYTVRIANGTAVPAFKASGDITSMSRADGYIEIAANVDRVEAGTPVDVTLF